MFDISRNEICTINDSGLGSSGRLMYSGDTYGVKLPNNSNWTVDKTLATLDDIVIPLIGLRS